MDIYEQMMDYFPSITELADWKETQTLFRNIGSSKPHHWMLPVWACEAVGGAPDQVLPAAVAMACSYISIILVDDMLDSDPRGEHHLTGMPAAANMACAFQAAGLATIIHSEIEPNAKFLALSAMNQMTLTTTLGQYWDTLCPDNEIAYWRIVQTKSSPFFGAALYIGALAGRGEMEVAERLKELGLLYGEMIQIHDDLNDSLEVPANPDWNSGRLSLPILFAQIVEHPDRQRFLELRHGPLDSDRLAEAQTILIRCGAISYGIDQLAQRFIKCREILSTLSLNDSRGLDRMLDDVINPVEKLVSALGIGHFSFPLKSRRSTARTSGGSPPI